MKLNVAIITSALTAARRQNCENVIRELKEKHDVTHKYIEDHEPDSIDKDFITNHIKMDVLTDPRLEKYNKYTRTLHVRHVSNSCKHLAALKLFAEQSDDSDAVNLVIEDDVLPANNWLENLETVVTKAPKDYVFLGISIPGTSGADYQTLGDGYEMLPCCDSYIVSTKGAKVLSKAFLPLRFSTPFQLTYVLKSLNLPSYLCKHRVFLDGSKFGAFISTMSGNNQLMLNKTYNDAYKMLQEDKTNLDEVSKLLENTPYKNHPDFMYLFALHKWRSGSAKEAEPMFKETLESYEANNAIVNKETPFLQDYIKLFRDLQEV